MADILTQIIEKRRTDIERLGVMFGREIPGERTRPIHSFLIGLDGDAARGVILEVKRASPSKGDIAPELNAGETALSYAEAGAAAISCLTEQNFFKGSLKDLMEVCRAVDDFSAQTGRPAPAVLRKDFLLNAEEVEVAYRAGADAVLLIARILTKETLLEMARTVVKCGLSALVEVRSDEDLEKIASVFGGVEFAGLTGKNGRFVFGVNSRDLATFKIDLLRPCMMSGKIREAVGKDARIVFESGVTTCECADAVGAMGFSGLLLGEAAAKNPEARAALVRAFTGAKVTKNAEFWRDFCDKRVNDTLVKICGLTRFEDAKLADNLGAAFLGFIFADAFPRSLTHGSRLSILLPRLEELKAKKIAVIVDIDSEESKTAAKLVKNDIFDALQFHKIPYEKISTEAPELLTLPHYFASDNVEDCEKLIKNGELRVLLDSREIVNSEEIYSSSSKSTYEIKWFAGGITPENAEKIIKNLHPELIDVSGGVEIENQTGIKDEKKLKKIMSFPN